MNYKELLKDKRWQLKVAKIKLQRDNTCFDCGEQNDYLQVHHYMYQWHLKPWEYEDCFLVLLCKKCHKERHKNPKKSYKKWSNIQEIKITKPNNKPEKVKTESIKITISGGEINE